MEVLKDFKVIPGGQSIGVKLNTVGVLVVGHHQINTINGKMSPGDLAGIKIGDIITEINGTKIEKMSDVAPFVQAAGDSGKPLKISVTRDEGKFETELLPLKDKNEPNFKLGLYIRDSAAGIGTMTFYHPQSKNMVLLVMLFLIWIQKGQLSLMMVKYYGLLLLPLKKGVMGIQEKN